MYTYVYNKIFSRVKIQTKRIFMKHFFSATFVATLFFFSFSLSLQAQGTVECDLPTSWDSINYTSFDQELADDALEFITVSIVDEVPLVCIEEIEKTYPEFKDLLLYGLYSEKIDSFALSHELTDELADYRERGMELISAKKDLRRLVVLRKESSLLLLRAELDDLSRMNWDSLSSNHRLLAKIFLKYLTVKSCYEGLDEIGFFVQKILKKLNEDIGSVDEVYIYTENAENFAKKYQLLDDFYHFRQTVFLFQEMHPKAQNEEGLWEETIRIREVVNLMKKLLHAYSSILISKADLGVMCKMINLSMSYDDINKVLFLFEQKRRI